MPLDAHELDEEALRTVAEAEQLLITDCMADRGHELHPEPLAGSPSTAFDLEQRPETFATVGITSERDARRYGYRGPSMAWLANLDTSSPSLTEEFGVEYTSALVECTDAAEESLRGDSTEAVQSPDHVANVTGELWSEASDRALEDSRLIDAVEAWSDCMSRSGHDYDVPVAPVEEFTAGLALEPGTEVPPPSEDEIATAVDDVACKRSTDLEAVWFTVESAYQSELISTNEDRLAEYESWLTAMLTRARRVLARG